jgi:hypothetical protein
MQEVWFKQEGVITRANIIARISNELFVGDIFAKDDSSKQGIFYLKDIFDGDVSTIPVGYPDVKVEESVSTFEVVAEVAPFTLENTDVLDKIVAILSKDTMSVASDMGAVVDDNGRYHAPHDGFEFEGRVYKGGEFLLEGEFRESYEIRVKMPLNHIVALKKAGVSVRYGRDWDFKGEQIAYATFVGERAKLRKLETMFPRGGKELLLHDESDSNRGAAFKFNTRKLSAILRGHNPEGDLDMTGFVAIPWKFVGDSVKSPWSGQMVSYKYYDDILRLV